MRFHTSHRQNASLSPHLTGLKKGMARFLRMATGQMRTLGPGANLSRNGQKFTLDLRSGDNRANLRRGSDARLQMTLHEGGRYDLSLEGDFSLEVLANQFDQLNIGEGLESW